MSDQPPAIRLALAERVATITLERPPLNVLDLASLARLEDVLVELADRDDLAVVVLRGAGARAFSAGVAVEDHTKEKIPAMLATFHGALRRLMALDAVTVAAVHGHCLGGGMELALSCDLVVASDDARFGQPEIKVGCYPPWAAALYPRRIGAGRAAELILSGRIADCAEAERLGLVARRAPAGELEAALDALLAELTAHSTPVLRLAKRALRAGRELPFDAAVAECERLYLEELTATEDVAEGVAAFLARRPPRWQHR
ncbi:MAG: enoyl-CoA hydratase/isomerase family protein [Acidobacteria bacterium]|nr:MAG: enoyl-CoA hydratase/isomerase family protein [Acidobacteriota bacterium]